MIFKFYGTEWVTPVLHQICTLPCHHIIPNIVTYVTICDSDEYLHFKERNSMKYCSHFEWWSTKIKIKENVLCNDNLVVDYFQNSQVPWEHYRNESVKIAFLHCKKELQVHGEDISGKRTIWTYCHQHL